MSPLKEATSRRIKMNSPLAKLILKEEKTEGLNNPIKTSTEAINGVRVGVIFSMEKNGKIVVDYPDNPVGPLCARSVINLTFADKNKEILLAFVNGNPQLPIITGLIQNKPVITEPSEELLINRKSVKEITMDSERIIFDAKKEIVMICGEGSVKMRRDGKIVIKGTNLISRAKATNKIKGASVNIN